MEFRVGGRGVNVSKEKTSKRGWLGIETHTCWFPPSLVRSEFGEQSRGRGLSIRFQLEQRKGGIEGGSSAVVGPVLGARSWSWYRWSRAASTEI